MKGNTLECSANNSAQNIFLIYFFIFQRRASYFLVEKTFCLTLMIMINRKTGSSTLATLHYIRFDKGKNPMTSPFSNSYLVIFTYLSDNVSKLIICLSEQMKCRPQIHKENL